MRRRMPGLGRYALLLVVTGLIGCADPDPIRQYEVAKATPADTFTPSPGSPAEPQQQRRVAWFFKLLGPNAEVVGLVEPFTQLVNSVRFDQEGNPNWTLPEGWTEQPESGLRHATIKLPGEPKLEISVMSLPAADPNSTEYLLSNFNRWRDQLGQAAVSGETGLKESRDKGELQQLDSAGRKVSLFNLAGKTAELSEARMLAAMIVGDPGKAAASPAPRPATPAADKPFTFTVPEGWKEAPLRTFQLAAFFVGEDEENRLLISISAAGGDLKANVNRWRGQAGLPEQSEQEINESARAIEVDGVPAKYFVVEGEKRAILGVIAPRKGTQWFLKADGPKPLAEQERDNFEAFVKSVRFKE